MMQQWPVRLAVTAMVAACSPEEAAVVEALSVEEPAPAVGEHPSKLTPLQDVGRALALALRDPALRELIHQEMAHSDVKEGKLQLQRFLRGPGAPLLASMAQATELREEGVSKLLRQLEPTELYLPVEAHRQRWSGGPDLIVATQWEESEQPVGFDLEGQPVALSLEKPPDVATLVIVPAESFDEEGSAYGRHLAQSGTVSAMGTWTGLWVNELHVNSGQYESWLKGSPEFELYLENASASPRSTITCASEDSIGPYRWDLNGDDYYASFLVAEDRYLPLNTRRVLTMWEDDDGRCSIKVNKDYVKLTTDAFMNAYDAYKLIHDKQYTNGQIIVKVYNAYIAARSAITGGDDYVGTAAGLENISTGASQFTLMNDTMNPTGWGVIQWRSVTIH